MKIFSAVISPKSAAKSVLKSAAGNFIGKNGIGGAVCYNSVRENIV